MATKNKSEPVKLEAAGKHPRWGEDFPIQWEEDNYVTRRELAKFLTLGSALLFGANLVIAALGRLSRPRRYPRVRVAKSAAIAPDNYFLFRYPTEQDPCILVRTEAAGYKAYSQVCTHLSCAVVYRSKEQELFCPCHHGRFSPFNGHPRSGPPTRRLPRVLLEEKSGEIYAVGMSY